MLEFGNIVKKSISKQKMLAWQYNAIGVSDAITMGSEGKHRGAWLFLCIVLVRLFFPSSKGLRLISPAPQACDSRSSHAT